MITFIILGLLCLEMYRYWIKTIVYLKQLNPLGIQPRYATPGSAGFDIYAAEEKVLEPGVVTCVKTGFSMELAEGYELQIRTKSGLALNHGVIVANSPGTIDSDYRGEVCVLLINVKEDPYVVRTAQKIAQGVVSAVERVYFQYKEELPSTERGKGGFGSTGINRHEE